MRPSVTSPRFPTATAATASSAARIGPRQFVMMMAMIMALQSLAIDSMLPALATLAHELGAPSANARQYVVGIFLISNGACSLYPGVLSDRFGRRPVLIGCLIGYVVASAACIIAPTFNILLVARAACGIAGAGLTVLPSAIIRDQFEGDRMARMQSMVAMVFMAVPILAPSVGQVVLLVAGWRWIFGLMAVMGCVVTAWTALLLPETLPPQFRQSIDPRRVVVALTRVITTRAAVGYVFGMAFIQGAMFGYINSTEQLLGEHFGAGRAFPLFFAGMAVSIAVANFVNANIVERFGARRVCHTALLFYILFSAIQLGMAVAGVETLWRFAAVMTVNMFLMGFLGANFTAIGLQPFAENAGAAASAQAVLRTGLGAAIGIWIGHAYDGSARPLALGMTLAGVGALTLVLFSERGRLFRRVFKRGTPRPAA